MTTITNRTCTEIRPSNSRLDVPVSVPLSDYRTESAYVLLGDPGLGKTTAFRTECMLHGDAAERIDARDFLVADLGNHQDWRRKTLFIDGLDEVRVGSSDARSALDEIRQRLGALGRPRFRISCRESDWLGDNDRNRLRFVSKTGQVTTLRLNPLSETEIELILLDHPDVGDPHAFIDAAKQRGVRELLANPQTLIMLADVVGSGLQWPESRLETFDMACGLMAREQNEEHAIGAPQPPLNQVLDAAGSLCAAQLITGSAGFSLDVDDSNYLALDSLASFVGKNAKAAISTRLFRRIDEGERRFEPIHRHVAEFLGARHLADRVKNGLPVRRIVSLISGVDGIVVSEMRGLSGWLAALCPQARDLLIERDLIGVALYGDLGDFATEEKRRLLDALGGRDALRRLGLDARSFERETLLAPLISGDMEPALIEILSQPARDTPHQNLVQYVLRLLLRGNPPPKLDTDLLGMTRDESRWPYVRSSALEVLIRIRGEQRQGAEDFQVLLEQIRVGAVSDPEDELRGALLAFLYPRDIPATRVWDYLGERSAPRINGRGSHFWSEELLEKSSDRDVADLLDELSARKADIWPVLNSHSRNLVPARLLARGLKAHGDDLPRGRLHKWLSAAVPPIEDMEDDPDADLGVRDWLAARPDVQKEVLLLGLSRWPNGQWTTEARYAVMAPLHGSMRPEDLASWFGEQAVRLWPSHREASEFLLYEALRACRYKGRSLDPLKDQIAGHKPLEDRLSAWLQQVSPEHRSLISERRSAREAQRETERQKGIDFVRGHALALRQNEGPLSLLHDLGRFYFRRRVSPEKPRDPIDRISDSLGGDDELIEAALAGLRGSPWRSELPPLEEILRLNRESRQHYLAYPVQAGLDLLHEERPDRLQELSDTQVVAAVAFYYCTPGSYQGPPAWYQSLAAGRPEIVAAVAADVAIAELRGRGDYWTALYALADMGGPPELKCEALFEVLSKFPLRARSELLRALDSLLWNVLDCSDEAELPQLIDAKLANSSMGVAQRVHWLAAGVVSAPEHYMEQATRFVRSSERRARHLADFFNAGDPLESDRREFNPATVRALIELMGPAFAPDSLYESGTFTPEMKASRQIERFIRRLGTMPGGDATQALATLMTDQRLSKWSDYIERAFDDQRVLHREATYSYPDFKQLQLALDNEEPANVGDLAALVVDRLMNVASDIQSSNADLWRQYWNEDSHGRPQTPKREESCRDALLGHIRKLLPVNVKAEPEVHHVGDKRSDIRVSYSDTNVPVEIKKVTHRDLWSAMRTQLIGRYTRDAGTYGYGIYLVFWFAGAEMAPPPKGSRPTTPSELQERLEQTLSDDEALKISVVVLDVSQPA